MSVVFGIHVGNTSACLAAFKDGKVDVIANDSGDRITPAVVAVNETEKVVGLAAKVNMARKSVSTVINNKQLLNESIDEAELEDIIKKSLCKIIREDDSIKYELKCGERTLLLTPESIATCIYNKLFVSASSSVKSESDLRVVLCVPLHYSQSSRQIVMRAAEEAGLEVLHIISEPAAAVLAHGIGIQNPEDECYCVIYRLGGITLDCTVIRVRAGMYAVCSTSHKNLGGNRFTKILAEYLAGEFRHKWKLDPLESRRSMVKLLSAAESCKHVLSTMSTAHCFVESLCEGVDFSYNITRARFENLISPVIQEYVQPIQEVLDNAGLKCTSINKVILSGGSVKIPKLQQAVGDLFPQAEVLGGMNPDEIIAIGAARHGSYLSKAVDPDCEHLAVEVPATSCALYIKQASESTHQCVIPALTPVPVKRVKKFDIDSTDVHYEIYEDAPLPCTNPRLLGKVSLCDIQGPTKVSLEISINSIGGLHAILADLNSQKKSSLKLDPPES